MGRTPEPAAPKTGGAAARPAMPAARAPGVGLKAPAAPARPAARPAAAATKPGMTPTPAKAAEAPPKRGDVSSWPAAAPKGAAPDAKVPAPSPVGQDVMAAASGDLAGKLQGLGLSADQVQGVLSLSRDVIEQVVWEVVPTLAEALIKEEIARLTKE